MKRFVWQYVIGILFILASVAYADQGASEYKLGPGDKINISVYGEEDLSLKVKLSDSGNFSYPFLGKIHVIGITVGELQNIIAEGLKGDYLVEPKVSVSVEEYRQFFINGEVKKPGGFAFQPGLTVGKAITLAEGFTERANKKRIFVVSESDKSQKPRQVQINSPLQPGDIVTVEQGFF